MNAVIIGGGQVGSYIANMLLKNNCHVRLIEKRQSVLEKLRTEIPEEVLVVGGGADPATLELAGINQADVVIAVTGADEINLVASTIAKYEFTVPQVIARVNNPKNEWLFTAKMGVDICFNQAKILGNLAVHQIDFHNMITLLKLGKGENSIVQLTVGKNAKAVHKKIRDLQIPKSNILIAIERDNETIVPHGDTEILGGEYILALVDENGEQYLNEIFN